MLTRAELHTLGEQIQAIEFDHPFVLHPNGAISGAPGVYAPSVFHSDADDIEIHADGWRALTGMTGQDRYHGAVMHSSEYIGSGIAKYLLELAADEPVTFVVVVVECCPEDDDPEPEPAGWTILYREAQP